MTTERDSKATQQRGGEQMRELRVPAPTLHQLQSQVTQIAATLQALTQTTKAQGTKQVTSSAIGADAVGTTNEPECQSPSDYAKQLERLRAENLSLKIRNAELERETKKLRDEQAALREEKVRRDEENASLKASHDTLRGRFQQMEEDLQELFRMNEGQRQPSRGGQSSLPLMGATPEDFQRSLLPSPQMTPYMTPRHQPYVSQSSTAGDALPSAMNSLHLDSSAYPLVPPPVHIPDGVVAEVLDFHTPGSGAADPEIVQKLTTLLAMAREMIQVQAYSTTALFSLGPPFRISRPEDLYTLWRSFGGKDGFSRCRSRTNALLQILETFPRDTVNVAPSNMYVKNNFLVLHEEEVSTFVSMVLGRLPKLRKLTLSGYTAWPLPPMNRPQERTAFPSLASIEVIDTPWHPGQVREFLHNWTENGQRCLKHITVTERLAPTGCDTGVLRADLSGLLRYM